MDPSIALRFRPARFDSPVNQLAQVLQIRGMQDQQEMSRLQADAYKRSVEDQDAMRAALSQPDADPYKVLLQRGNVKGAMDWQKGQLEAQKAQREAAKADLEMGLKRAEHVGSILSLARDPQSYAQVRQVIAQNYGKQLPEQFDPMFVQATIAEGQTLTQRLAAEHQRLTLAETGRHNQATEQNAAGQLRVAQGNLGMRRQELQHAQNQPRGQFIETTNGYMLADPKSGTVRPVMGPDGQPLRGKAADRSLNETQAKANLFGSRMRESDAILSRLEDQGVTNSGLIKGAVQGVAGMTPFMGDKMSDAAGSVMNTLPSALGGPNSDQQLVDQARRDFLNAVLRRESGAVISPQEFANADRQYFPQPGDSKAVLEQKRRNRKLAISGLEAEVPGGFRGGPTGGGTGRSASGQVGEVAPPKPGAVLKFDANGNPI